MFQTYPQPRGILDSKLISMIFCEEQRDGVLKLISMKRTEAINLFSGSSAGV